MVFGFDQINRGCSIRSAAGYRQSCHSFKQKTGFLLCLWPCYRNLRNHIFSSCVIKLGLLRLHPQPHAIPQIDGWYSIWPSLCGARIFWCLYFKSGMAVAFPNLKEQNPRRYENKTILENFLFLFLVFFKWILQWVSHPLSALQTPTLTELEPSLIGFLAGNPCQWWPLEGRKLKLWW